MSASHSSVVSIRRTSPTPRPSMPVCIGRAATGRRVKGFTDTAPTPALWCRETRGVGATVTRRCSTCGSTVLLEHETDRLVLVCLGCGRRWEQATGREEAYRTGLDALRARMQAGQRPVR